jgi:hypothetical protein
MGVINPVISVASVNRSFLFLGELLTIVSMHNERYHSGKDDQNCTPLCSLRLCRLIGSRPLCHPQPDTRQ